MPNIIKYNKKIITTIIIVLFPYLLTAQEEESKTIITLDSITITALGMQSQKRSIGYSISTLQGDELEQNSINPLSSLQGKVAGLTISGSDGGIFGRQKIQLRGASTLNKNNQPLIIVDGIVLNTSPLEGNMWYYWGLHDYGDQLNDLNTADIKSISVLKGAAATALYGSRGMNGALVITTKSGNYQQGIGVTISQSLGFDLVTHTPAFQTTYGPGTIAGDIYYGQQEFDFMVRLHQNR